MPNQFKFRARTTYRLALDGAIKANKDMNGFGYESFTIAKKALLPTANLPQ